MGKLINRIGQTYGELLVLERDLSVNKNRPYWKCECSCGKIITIRGADLVSGNTKSCGCYKIKRTKETCRKNFIGNKYGKLTVIEELEEYDNSKHRIMLCQCDCGNIIKVSVGSLNNKNTESCGCLSSKGEAKIQKILTKNNISFKKQYIFKNLISPRGGYLRFDFAIFTDENELEYLLEYDGIQHFEYKDNGWQSKEKYDIIKENDLLKNKYCKDNNIKLVRIRYDEAISSESIRGECH